jgi:hypothetical protein
VRSRILVRSKAFRTFLFFALLTGTLVFAGRANAQDATCSLKLEPVSDKTGDVEEGFSGSIEISGTKSQLISKKEDPALYFDELAEGTYRVFLTKLGFKNISFELKLSAGESQTKCERAMRVPVFEGPRTETIELQYLAETGEFKVGRTLRDTPVVAGERDVVVYDKQVLNGGAVFLPAPLYPKSARLMNVKGLVQVAVVIDTEGNVRSANAISGPPLLRRPSEDAALKARFKPTLLSGEPVEVSGVIVYNFQ